MGKKILIIGATGTIGQAIVHAMKEQNNLIEVGHAHGDHQVDVTDSQSIKTLFQKIGMVDAIISVTGTVHFGSFHEMTAEQFQIGLRSKLLGQVDLALIGQHYLTDDGSITLTSGILSEQPIPLGVNATTVNLAIEGFVLAAACELSRGQRINAVSPSVLEEAMGTYGPYFKGFEPVPGSRVALAYIRSVEGIQTGKVFRVW